MEHGLALQNVVVVLCDAEYRGGWVWYIPSNINIYSVQESDEGMAHLDWS